MRYKRIFLVCILLILPLKSIEVYANQTDIGFGFSQESSSSLKSSDTEPSTTGSTRISSNSSKDQVQVINDGNNEGDNNRVKQRYLPQTGMNRNYFFIYLGLSMIGISIYLIRRKERGR